MKKPIDWEINDVDSKNIPWSLSEETPKELTKTLEDTLSIETLSAFWEDVFGEKEKFESWLQESIIALWNQRPIDLLSTEEWRKIVYEALVRIQHGVYA